MACAFSDDFRTRVLSASCNGMAARFGIEVSTAIAWIANARQGQMTLAKHVERLPSGYTGGLYRCDDRRTEGHHA